MTETAHRPKLIHWLLLLLLGTIWGSSYILIKRGLLAFSWDQVACLRIGITSLAFLPILLMQYSKIDWSKWPLLLVVALMGTGFPAFLFPFAQTHISSSVAGVLSSLTPLFTLLWGILFFRIPFEWPRVIGVVIGLCGAVVLIVFGKSISLGENHWYGGFIVLACMFYGVNANTIHTRLKQVPTLLINAASMSMLLLPALMYLFSTDFTSRLHQNPEALGSLGYLCILSLLGTFTANLIFYHLIQSTNAVFASMVCYLMPVVALGWGLLDQEEITVYHFIGMALILTGIYVISFVRSKQ